MYFRADKTHHFNAHMQYVAPYLLNARHISSPLQILSEFSLQPYEVASEAQRGQTVFPGYQPVNAELRGHIQAVWL